MLFLLFILNKNEQKKIILDKEKDIIELNSKNESLSCYPNPFEKETLIKLNTTERVNLWQLNVYSEEGKLVRTEKIANSNELLFDKNNLCQGIYFYQALKDKEILGIGKFIISK